MFTRCSKNIVRALSGVPSFSAAAGGATHLSWANQLPVHTSPGRRQRIASSEQYLALRSVRTMRDYSAYIHVTLYLFCFRP